jgi:hypothetical protein
MRVHLKTLRRILNEVAEYSALNIKPGMVLRYTGHDMEKPPMLKVLQVKGSESGVMTIVAGDKSGNVHKISSEDLKMGEYEVAKGGMPAAKKPASWQATR